MTFSELIDTLLTDLAEPVDGTGFRTRLDVLKQISKYQVEISRDCRNILSTTATIEPAISTEEITIDANGNLIDIIGGWRTYGSDTRDIFVYDLQQIQEYDASWKTRTGAKVKGIITGIVTTEGKARIYPITDDALNDLVFTYIKMATRVTAEFTEAGDASSQLSSWYLTGITDAFLATGKILYWSLTNVTTTRTVKLYSNSAMTAGYLVAQGSRTGDGSITLTAQNDSGISGTVTVAFTVDDTTNANTLTFKAIEIPEQDITCLEYAVKAALYRMEKDGKDFEKSTFWFDMAEKEKEKVRGRAVERREGSFRTLAVRAGATETLWQRPIYPLEVD